MAVVLQHGLNRETLRLVWRGLAVCLVVGSFQATFAGDPYTTIYQRNVFHLRPPPAAAPVELPRTPLPRIRLTGITTILPGKRALLKVELPGKPANQAQSYILTEGQKAGALEVLKINEKTSLVTVAYSGTITNLTFEKLTPTASPATSPAPTRAVLRSRGMTYRTAYRQ
jgi:hypothetical protein